MKVDFDSIVSVLALFDPEDIPYIKSDTYLKFKEEYLEGKTFNKEDKCKVKKLGDKNDRSGK